MPTSMHIIKQEDDDKLDFEVEVDKYGVLDLVVRDRETFPRENFTLTVNKAEAERLVSAIQTLYQDVEVTNGQE